MTITEYLDLKRFPLITRTRYKPKEQLMMDAFNYDQLKEYLEDHQPTEDEAKLFAELSQKMQHNARLTGKLAQGMRGGTE